MIRRFETVDVFTEQRFGGNPLAVFVDAAGIDDATMQALAAEMNYSETTFVLPPNDPVNTARVRIFNRQHEMPFAGHPMVGTAFVLARLGQFKGREARFEVPAGIVAVTLELDPGGLAIGAKVEAPQFFNVGMAIPAATVADCLGLRESDVVIDHHAPVIGSAGNHYVLAEVTEAAIARCQPEIAKFRDAATKRPALGGRFSVLAYARDGNRLYARMFAPLAGTWEDPATGSANAPLAGLLLSLGDSEHAEFAVRQGIEMGRPSLLHTTARRTVDGIVVTVAGRCQPVFSGTIDL
ncbi:MAG: PhzF family phenazine biosynthesis protein [Rhodospirillales bacterium]|nr:PhzF family phenazine biosynthesis protein [Rhodospirillales bacterium]